MIAFPSAMTTPPAAPRVKGVTKRELQVAKLIAMGCFINDGNKQ